MSNERKSELLSLIEQIGAEFQRREPNAKVIADDSMWDEVETCSLYVESEQWLGNATFYHLKGIQFDYYVEQRGYGASKGNCASVDHLLRWLKL